MSHVNSVLFNKLEYNFEGRRSRAPVCLCCGPWEGQIPLVRAPRGGGVGSASMGRRKLHLPLRPSGRGR